MTKLKNTAISSPMLNRVSSSIKRSLVGLFITSWFNRLLRRDVLLAIGFTSWKEGFIAAFASDHTVLHINSPEKFQLVTNILNSNAKQCIVWSFEETKNESWKNVNLFSCPSIRSARVEDGFIRSVGRGLDHVPPWSLCVDTIGMYYDASAPSDFEILCNELIDADFVRNRDEAIDCMNLIKALKLCKYNDVNADLPNARCFQLEHVPHSILVLGQVENDQSILRNSNKISTNRQLIATARSDHPHSLIRFKQHPDCLGERKRPGFVAQADLEDVEVVPAAYSIHDAIMSVDHVYTISSLGGFEALLWGRNVTTFGCPFYAGWGLTIDHCKLPRRIRKLSLLELFYISYIVYPIYFNPLSGERMELRQLLHSLSAQMRAKNVTL